MEAALHETTSLGALADESNATGALDTGLISILADDGSLKRSDITALPTMGVRVQAYAEMKRLRLLDARMILLQRQGRVGFYGACTGQEVTPIATALACQPADWLFPALRESVAMLVRGFPLVPYLAQIFGCSGDILKGRQMPSHMSAKEVHQVSWSSCIGTQLPQAVGTAWAAKLRGDPIVTVGFVGDGGTSEPDFHNAMNFAAVHKVPCVIICQNNHWAISVPAAKQTASETIAIKGRAYGVPSARVDGNDFLATYAVIREAVAQARYGGGPAFIEAVTYRVGAHSTSDDPTRYRSQDEVDSWIARDPVLRLRKHLLREGALTDAQEAAMEDRFNQEIAAAIATVEAMGPPERASLFDDVYAELPWNLQEQRETLLSCPPAPAPHG